MSTNVFRLTVTLSLLAIFETLAAGQLPYRARYGSGVGDPFAGGAYAGIADLNGDGYGDFLVGNGSFSGRVLAVSGIDGSTILDLTGPQIGSLFGASLVALDDLDGDGLQEFLVGIPGYDPGPPLTNSGAVVVLSGADGSLVRAHTGSATNAMAGAKVANIGDVDLDGVADYVFEETVGNRFLKVHSGATGALINSIPVLPAQLYPAFPTFAHNSSDIILEPAGDVNGDGRGDILVGMPGANPTSSIIGATDGGVLVYSAFTGTVLHAINGTSQNILGSSVAPAGDRNADGLDDFYVGEGGANQVQLRSGADGSILATLLSPTLAALGWEIAAGEDLNGDGIDDLACFSPEYSAGNYPDNPGRVLVFSGLDQSLITLIPGTNPSEWLGEILVVCGDLDGDGMGEILASSKEPSSQPFFIPPAPYGLQVLSVVGSRAYGVSGGQRPLGLAWDNSGSMDPAVGVLVCDGADSFANGVIAASLAPANSMISGMPLLVANDPINLLPLAYFGFDVTGQLLYPLSLRSPFVNGTTYFLQGFQSTFPYGASNGLELLFTL